MLIYTPLFSLVEYNYYVDRGFFQLSFAGGAIKVTGQPPNSYNLPGEWLLTHEQALELLWEIQHHPELEVSVSSGLIDYLESQVSQIPPIAESDPALNAAWNPNITNEHIQDSPPPLTPSEDTPSSGELSTFFNS